MMNRLVQILRWVVAVIVIFLTMSYLSKEAFEKKFYNERRNLPEKVIISASKIPSILKTWYTDTFVSPPLSFDITNHLDGNIFEIGKVPHDIHINDSLYVLYYQYLEDGQGSVYLKNVKSGEIAFEWKIPLDIVLDDLLAIDEMLVNRYKNNSLPINLTMKVAKNRSSIGISQSIIVDDYSLIFHCGGLGYMYKIDKNSNIIWKSNRLTHHSIALDAHKNIWTCSIDLDNDTANNLRYREDAIVSYSQSGQELKFVSLTKILKENKLFKRLIASTPNYNNDKYGLDPYHLNDVLPALNDSKNWKRDDLFLSFRTQSMIMQYRPSNDSIIWFERGPWFGQHDVNIINDSVISVFNNNIWFFNNKYLEPGTSSNIAFYNFSTNRTEFRYNDVFVSAYEGRQTSLPNDELIVEATEKGIYYYFDKNQELIVRFYSPYGSSQDNLAMRPRWSRFYLKSDKEFELLR